MLLRITFSTLFAAALLAVGGAVAQADMVSVASVGTVQWMAGTQSGYVNINLYDENPTGVKLYSWALGLRVVPIGTATGTVTIDTASMTYAPSPILTDPFPLTNPSVTTNQPTAGDVTVFAADNDFLNLPTVLGTPNGMLSVKFNASSNAGGLFALQLVGGVPYTSWADEGGVDQPFHYLGSPIGATPVQIGTFAVPEPSSILLTGALAGLAAWRTRRKLRNTASTPSVAA